MNLDNKVNNNWLEWIHGQNQVSTDWNEFFYNISKDNLE